MRTRTLERKDTNASFVQNGSDNLVPGLHMKEHTLVASLTSAVIVTRHLLLGGISSCMSSHITQISATNAKFAQRNSKITVPRQHMRELMRSITSVPFVEKYLQGNTIGKNISTGT